MSNSIVVDRQLRSRNNNVHQLKNVEDIYYLSSSLRSRSRSRSRSYSYEQKKSSSKYPSYKKTKYKQFPLKKHDGDSSEYRPSRRSSGSSVSLKAPQKTKSYIKQQNTDLFKELVAVANKQIFLPDIQVLDIKPNYNSRLKSLFNNNLLNESISKELIRAIHYVTKEKIFQSTSIALNSRNIKADYSNQIVDVIANWIRNNTTDIKKCK